MSVRILIVDDHFILREGLKTILEPYSSISVIGEACNGREALQQAELLRPDVIIMDIAMPELNGIEATRMISDTLPAIKIIILTMYDSREHVHRALSAGAVGYLLKEASSTAVIKAINTVMKGQRYLDDALGAIDVPGTGIPKDAGKSPIESLSIRELEVFQLVVEGKTSAEIAEVLALSPKSVDTYRSRLMIKLEVSNLPSLVKLAVLHGITSV